MRGAIAEDAEFVKKVGDLGGKHSVETQSAKQVRLGFVVLFIKTRLCGDQLGKQFAELAKFDEACICVVMKIAFGERTQPHELMVVCFKKSKIPRGHSALLRN